MINYVVIYFNPHTGVALHTIHDNLKRSYKLISHISKKANPATATSTIPQNIASILAGITQSSFGDILSIIFQIDNICNLPDHLNLIYPLHPSVPYSLVTMDERLMINSDNIKINTHELHDPTNKNIELVYAIDSSYLIDQSSISRMYLVDQRTLQDLYPIISATQHRFVILQNSKPMDFDTLDRFRSFLFESQNYESKFVETIDQSITTIQGHLPTYLDALETVKQTTVTLLNSSYPLIKENIILGRLDYIFNYRIHHHLLPAVALDAVFRNNPVEWVLNWNSWIGEAQLLHQMHDIYQFRLYGYQHGTFLWEPIYYRARFDIQFVFNEVEKQKLISYYHDPQRIIPVGYPISGIDEKLDSADKVGTEAISVLIILQHLNTAPELYTLLDILVDLIPHYPTIRFIFRLHPRDGRGTLDTKYVEILEEGHVSIDDSKRITDALSPNTICLGMNSSALIDAMLLGQPVIEWLPVTESYSYLAEYGKNVIAFTSSNELKSIFADILSGSRILTSEESSEIISYGKYFNTILQRIEELEV